MCDTYFIRGTISVQVGSGKLILLVTPCAGFLTPYKKKAIAFPYRSNLSTKAELIDLEDGETVACVAEEMALCLPTLIALATQSKPIELSLNVSTPKNIKVTGFTFPAPTDYAHGC